MKTKPLILISILILSHGWLAAQQAERPLRFMIHAQPCMTWLHADETHLTAGPVRVGFDGGMRLDYSFDRFYAFSFGADWNLTGGSLLFQDTLFLDRINKFDTLAPQTRLTYHLQYVDIPFSVKFKTPQIGYTTLFTEVGLDPMINIRALIDAADNNISKEPFQQGVGPFNLGYHLGAGMIYSFGNGMGLQIQVIYKNTFLDVTKENDIRLPDNTRINQAGLSIGLIF